MIQGFSKIRHSWIEQARFDPLVESINHRVNQILAYSARLSQIDPRTERITKPLEYYSNGVVFHRLGDASLDSCRTQLVLSLNVETINRFKSFFTQESTDTYLINAILIFLFHEVCHISQGIKVYEDVRKIKRSGDDLGREFIAEFDLRSDFLAAHTLTLFQVLVQNGEYNRRLYIQWLHEIWCKICWQMLKVFPTPNRKDKYQRFFGYLLMFNLIRDSSLYPYRLDLDSELFPVWNENLDRLAIRNESGFLIPGCSVDPSLMRLVLRDLKLGNYEDASLRINQIWCNLDRF